MTLNDTRVTNMGGWATESCIHSFSNSSTAETTRQRNDLNNALSFKRGSLQFCEAASGTPHAPNWRDCVVQAFFLSQASQNFKRSVSQCGVVVPANGCGRFHSKSVLPSQRRLLQCSGIQNN